MKAGGGTCIIMFGNVGRCLLIPLVATAAAVALPGPAGPTTSRPVRVSLTLRDGGRVRGMLVRLEAQQLVIGAGGKVRTIPLGDVAPASLYMVRRQVLDLSKPAVHLELGTYCLRHGLARLAEREFAETLRMDPSLAGRIERARAAASRPAGDATGDGDGMVGFRPPKPAAKDVRKYPPATADQIASARKRAERWADETRRFAPALHPVETPHFRIYSAWDRANDKALRETCEKLYAAMCRQFDIPATENIWVDKAAVFVFWQREHFAKFCTDVYGKGNPKASGYCGWYGDGFVFIAMGPCRTRAWFYEVLVHEATHGFLARYRGNGHVPSWVHEGLADYMAATLVAGAQAGRKYIRATREAVRKDRRADGIFEKVGMDWFDYGIAQSWVRYLIARDRKAFIRFVQAMKDGRSDEEALGAAFGLTRRQFLRQWRRAAVRAVGP